MPPCPAPFFRTLPRIKAVEMRCPHCGRFHVDREEWAHRPHKTHLCEHCDLEFSRPWSGYYERGIEPVSVRGRLIAARHSFANWLFRKLA